MKNKVRHNRIKKRTHKVHKAHKASKSPAKKLVAVASLSTKSVEGLKPVRSAERSKGQSALATTVAVDELEERRRLFAKARKGDKGAVAKIYELYGARIYTTAQVKEVRPGTFVMPLPQSRKRARTA